MSKQHSESYFHGCWGWLHAGVVVEGVIILELMSLWKANSSPLQPFQHCNSSGPSFNAFWDFTRAVHRDSKGSKQQLHQRAYYMFPRTFSDDHTGILFTHSGFILAEIPLKSCRSHLLAGSSNHRGKTIGIYSDLLFLLPHSVLPSSALRGWGWGFSYMYLCSHLPFASSPSGFHSSPLISFPSASLIPQC